MEELEPRLAPAYLKVVVTSAQVSASLSAPNEATNLQVPRSSVPNLIATNRTQPADRTIDSSAHAAVRDFLASFRTGEGPGLPEVSTGVFLSQQATNPPRDPQDLHGHAKADIQVTILPDSDKPDEVGRLVRLMALAEIESLFGVSTGSTTYGVVSYADDKGSGIVLSGRARDQPSVRTVGTREFVVEVGQNVTFHVETEAGSFPTGYHPGTEDNPSFFHSRANIATKVQFVLSDVFVSRLAVRNSIPINEVSNDFLWSADQPNRYGAPDPTTEESRGGSIADSLTLYPGNPAGFQIIPHFLSRGFPAMTDQVAATWSIYPVDRDGKIGDRALLSIPTQIKKSVQEILSATNPADVFTIDIPTPQAVGLYELRLQFTVMDAAGQRRETQKLTHRLSVTYGQPYDMSRVSPGDFPKVAGGYTKEWFERAAAWGAAPGQASPASPEVLLPQILTQLMRTVYSNPLGWKYSIVRHDAAYRPAQTVEGLLFRSARYAECGVLARTWASLAATLGIPHVRIAGLTGEFNKGFVLRPGLVAFDGSRGNAGLLNRATGEVAAPDRWVWGSHAVGLYDRTDTGEITAFDPTYGVAYPFEKCYDPSASPIAASFKPQGFWEAWWWHTWSTEPDGAGTVFVEWDDRSEGASPGHLTGFYAYTVESGPPVPSPPRPSGRGTARFVGQPRGMDSNGDGAYDALALEVSVQAPAGTYRILSRLTGPDGIISERSSSEERGRPIVTVTVGEGERAAVTLRFSGEDIFRAGTDGPYVVSSVLVGERGEVLDLQSTPTSAFEHDQFGEARARLTGAAVRYRDDNADRAFDALVVDASVRVYQPGDYRVTAIVLSAAGAPVVSTSTTAQLDASGVISLPIDGALLRGATVPGPYGVRLQLYGTRVEVPETLDVPIPPYDPGPEPPPPTPGPGVTALLVDDRNLYRLGPTGAADLVGRLPFVPFDIAIGPDGTFYAATYEGMTGSALYRLTVGANGIEARRVGSMGAFVNALTFVPDGSLLGAGIFHLYRIDIRTGLGTHLSDGPAAVLSAGDLAVGPGGELYLTSDGGGGHLVRISADYRAWSVLPEPTAPGLGGLTMSGGMLVGYGQHGAVYEIEPATGRARLVRTLAHVGSVTGYAAGRLASIEPAAPSAHERYVTQVYNDLLRRAPENGGLAYWSGRLDQGEDRAAIAALLTRSAEYYQTNVIKPAYRQFLGREPDALGLDYWTAQLQAGLTDEAMQAGFLASDEFYNGADGSDVPVAPTPERDRAWLTAHYQVLLGRAPEASALDFWGQALRGTSSRAGVAAAITNSVEGIRARVNDTYRRYLRRDADSAGLDYWVGQYRRSLVNEDLVMALIGSPEYFTRATGS